MKKWENPELQVLSLEKTEWGRIKEVVGCEVCIGNVMFLVGEVICYYCECCGKEFHSKDYGGNKEALNEAQKHEDTCDQCPTS